MSQKLAGHAAFPHPALHMADLLSNFCVFNTFLLKKVVFLLLQSLSIAQVTFLVIAICGSLHRMQTPIPIETSTLSSITSRRKFKSPEFSK